MAVEFALFWRFLLSSRRHHSGVARAYNTTGTEFLTCQIIFCKLFVFAIFRMLHRYASRSGSLALGRRRMAGAPLRKPLPERRMFPVAREVQQVLSRGLCLDHSADNGHIERRESGAEECVHPAPPQRLMLSLDYGTRKAWCGSRWRLDDYLFPSRGRSPQRAKIVGTALLT